MLKIAPSFLSADFCNLGKDIALMNECADIFHMDIMDGVFVPNISYGFPVVNAIASKACRPLDVHLMICNPEKYALKFAEIPAVQMVSFHLEALREPDALLDALRSAGVKAGLVINPDVPVTELYPHLDHCDFVLIMSVFAGFGGQKFIPESVERVAQIKAEIQRRGLDVSIEVDGGVNADNASVLAKAGADILVAGTSVFKASDPVAAIAALKGE